MDDDIQTILDAIDDDTEEVEVVVEDVKPKRGGRKKKAEDLSEDARLDVNPAMRDWLKKFGKINHDAVQGEGYRQKIQTGIIPFDVSMGVGGLPFGGILTIYGEEGTGKTTFWQHIIGCSQRQFPDKPVLIFDTEAKFDAPTAVRNGMLINRDLFEQRRLMFYTPDLANGLSYEKIIMMVESLITPNDSGTMPFPNGIVIVIDSADDLILQAEMNKDADDGAVAFGGLAKAHGYLLKRIVGRLKDTDSLLIATQQGRDKVSSGPTYGKPQLWTSGGRAIRHASKVRIELMKLEKIKIGPRDNQHVVGRRVRGTLHKNNYNTLSEFEADLRFDWNEDFPGGFDRASGLIDVGRDVECLNVTGAAHEFVNMQNDKGEPVIIQGREKARAWLLANPGKMELLDQSIRAKLYGA